MSSDKGAPQDGEHETVHNDLHDDQADSMSEDDDIDPKAFMFYPDGKSRKTSKFFLDAPMCPGQSEPYVLPPNIDLCPIVGCPANVSSRQFKPSWRLNEHMKTRHGWPRRGPPNQRLSSVPQKSAKYEAPASGRSLRATRGRRESAMSNGSFPSSTSKRKLGDDDQANESSFLSEPLADFSPARPMRNRRQTAKGKEMANSMAKLDAATTDRPSKRDDEEDTDATISDNEGGSNDDLSEPLSPAQDDPSGTDGAMDVDLSLSPPSIAPQEDTRDHDMTDQIRILIDELREASPQNKDLDKIAGEYEDLVDQGKVCFNMSLTEREASNLFSCYKRAAERHNARAMIYSMQSSQRSPVDMNYGGRMNVGTPTETHPPPRKASPPKSFTFINDAPKPKVKKVNRYTIEDSQRRNPSSAGPLETAKPIMLRLNLGSGKEKAPVEV